MSEAIRGARPPTAISFHPMPGGGVLFDATRGRLYALNPAAGLIWLCVRDGLTEHESTLALAEAFALDQSIGTEWLRTSLANFQHLGLLESPGATPPVAFVQQPQVSPHPYKPLWRHGAQIEYRLVDQIFHLSAPPSQMAAVESLLGGVRHDPGHGAQDRGGAATEVAIVPKGKQWDIVVDGRLMISCAEAAIVAELERILVQAALQATPHLLALHAAALQRDGRSLLLAGLSRAGKTSLSLALSRAGWSFASDEIVLLTRDQGLKTLALPPCVKEASFPLIESWFPELRTVPQHDRFGHIVKYLPIRSTPISAWHGCVIFLKFSPHGPNKIKPLDRLSALERLLEQCVFVRPGFQCGDVEPLLRWHAAQSYFALSYCDYEEAVAAVSDMHANCLDAP